MNLEEYLMGIRNCLDELVAVPSTTQRIHKLTAEYGVYDNFPTLLKTDFQKVEDYFNSSGFFSLKHKGGSILFKWGDGPIITELHECVSPCDLTLGEQTEEREQHRQRQLSTYVLSAVLHFETDCFSHKDMPFYAAVIDLLSEDLIKKQGIPACFPRSMGWKHPNKFSRIVYFEGN